VDFSWLREVEEDMAAGGFLQSNMSCAVVENASVIAERMLTISSLTDLYSLSFTPDRRTRKHVHEQRLTAR
jgi:hypothetical protein